MNNTVEQKTAKRHLLRRVESLIRSGELTCPHKPLEWYFEVTRKCNIRCLTCARVYDDRYGDNSFTGSMAPEIVEKAASSLSDSIVVSPTGFGEPMLNRHLLDYMRTISQHASYMSLISNGTLLEGKEEELINSGLSKLFVSMDGGTKEVFEHFRRGAKWDVAVRALETLCALKKSRGLSKPEIVIEFVVMRGNIHTLPRMVEHAAEWGVGGITVDALFNNISKGYMDFYNTENLSNMPFEETEAFFQEAEALAKKHGVRLTGPYVTGDRRQLWESTKVQALHGVDCPTPNQVFRTPAEFGGWALHPAGIEKVTYRIGESAWGTAQFGIPREEVAATFGNSPMFPDMRACGFTIQVDPGMMTQGENTICLSLHGRDGSRVDLDPVKFHYEPPAELALDRPVSGARLDARDCLMGWSTPTEPKGLSVSIDDKAMGDVLWGIDRQDVREALRKRGCEVDDSADVGFYLPLDLSDLEDGPHVLRVKRGRNGDISGSDLRLDFVLERGSSRKGKVAAKAAGEIEFPRSGCSLTGSQPFSGWAVYGPDTRSLELRCDGALIPAMAHMVRRADVVDRLADESLVAELGFVAQLDMGELSPGDHAIALVAVSETGTTEALSELRVTVPHDGSEDRGPEVREPNAPAAQSRVPDPTPLPTADPAPVAAPPEKTEFAPLCTAPWTTAFISFDGVVKPCCFSDAGGNLGSLRHQTFEEIWNGKEYRQLRQDFLDHKVPEMCRTCVANKRYLGFGEFDRFRSHL
jgi:radical SAM protein with 4Fe4S-binding SPASM domain